MINKAEENMVELRRQYELSVQERNRRGVQLIERFLQIFFYFLCFISMVKIKTSILGAGTFVCQKKIYSTNYRKWK